ncbi:MAG: hypothetical protein J7L21_03195 [Sulfurimonas sp.]|nr:hypothetical protein [Sulfurimonas sp.]
MKKITMVIALLGAMFFLTGCPSEYANPTLIAKNKGSYGPYPTNYKEVVKRAWNGGWDYAHNKEIYQDSITYSKPYKAYSRVAGTDRPQIFGYFVRTCAKFKDGREKRCHRLIVRKYSIYNHTNKPDKGYYQILVYEPFFKEPWLKGEKNDVYP